ncbi:MAG: electron transport complex subunit RsxC [Alphaproteobacteria bacterium]|nr:electron transport complex subunit RsxC [Alphaproteobacteria bacterium]
MLFNIVGINLKKNKLSRHEAIRDIGLPKTVSIPLKKHIGHPAVAVVNEGDKVKIGMLLAKANNTISANVHASVAGRVSKIDEDYIHINTSKDEAEDYIDFSDELITEIPQDKEEILALIRDAGIVGMGGAGFPTDIKLSVPTGKEIKCLILNGIECEPYFTGDERLMLEKAEEIVIGARIINRLLGIQNAIIAVDEKKKKAFEILTSITKRYIGVNVKLLTNKYPQGAEKMLVEAVSGEEVPSGKLPMDMGYVVQNVGTVYAIYQAVMKKKPLYERVVTVSGDAVAKPKNYMVRIGTPVSFIAEKAKVDIKEVEELLIGGPMMGTDIDDLSTPVSKLDGGVLFLKKAKPETEESVCIRCNKCAQHCPIALQPFAIANSYKAGDKPNLYKLRALDCINCGICSYVCPAKIPLLDYIKQAKNEIR